MIALSERDVRALLDMESCIAVMEQTLAELARGALYQPLRTIARPPGAGGFIGLMPAYRGGTRSVYALKEIVVTPDNPARGLDAHQGAVLLHDGRTGELVAVLNASPVTEIRTAAVSAVATRTLANPKSQRVAVLGAGVQARAHVEAMRAVLREAEILIWARRPEAARQLASEAGAAVSPSVEAAVRDADVVCATTSAREPIVKRRWLAPGVHVNAVGAFGDACELDTETVASSSFFVDRRESALNEGGDYGRAAADGAIGPGHIRAELGEVLAGQQAGRERRDELTVFKSYGIGVEISPSPSSSSAVLASGGSGRRSSSDRLRSLHAHARQESGARNG